MIYHSKRKCRVDVSKYVLYMASLCYGEKSFPHECFENYVCTGLTYSGILACMYCRDAEKPFKVGS